MASAKSELVSQLKVSTRCPPARPLPRSGIRGTTFTAAGDTNPPSLEGGPTIPSRASVSTTLSSILPSVGPLPDGDDVGDGLPPVPAKAVAKIRRGEFVKMGKLLPELLASQRDKDPEGKHEPKDRRSRRYPDMGEVLWPIRERAGATCRPPVYRADDVHGSDYSHQPGLSGCNMTWPIIHRQRLPATPTGQPSIPFTRSASQAELSYHGNRGHAC